jgi:hypothetical protein
MSYSQKVQARLQAIEERLARLRSERDRVAARASKTARRQETRRKIVIGGTVLAAIDHEGVPAMQTKADLLKWLESRLTRRMTGACSSSRRASPRDRPPSARRPRACGRRAGRRMAVLVSATGALWRFCETPSVRLWPR